MSVVFLFLLPLITMRSYAEEKRSGTIELLLTSPLTDLEIVAGQVPRRDGALRVHARGDRRFTSACCSRSAPRTGSRWPPRYLGIVLFGGCFVAIGLFISSLTKNQIIAGAATFASVLRLWVIDWLGTEPGPDAAEAVLKYLSMTEHLDDFVKGVVDTKHLVYYLSFITFGLFLTVKSVDSERWRG